MTHPLAHHVDALIIHEAVRPGEIDELEHAQRTSCGRQRLDLPGAGPVYDNDLAGFDLAHEPAAYKIERTCFRRQDVMPGIQLPQAQGPDAIRVAHADQPIGSQQNHGVGPLRLVHHLLDCFLDGACAASGDQPGNDLSIACRFELLTPGFQLGPQLASVYEIPVMPHRDRPVWRLAHDRLGVPQHARSRGGVSIVAHGNVARQVTKLPLVEHLIDQAHVFEDADLAPVRNGDPGALLAPMLEPEQTEVRQPGDVLPLGVHAEDSAFLAWVVKAICQDLPFPCC